jgi:hypothetical protein
MKTIPWLIGVAALLLAFAWLLVQGCGPGDRPPEAAGKEDDPTRAEMVKGTLPSGDPPEAKSEDEDPDRPILAIWRDDEGNVMRHHPAAPGPLTGPPYLRIAIWRDGRIVFARDPATWSHDLCEAQLSAERVTRLRREIHATGVFDLGGNCYLVPDAPEDCIMIAFGGKRQMLYWDERDIPGYGINAVWSPQREDFKTCWRAVNRLAVEAIPAHPQPVRGQFLRAPKSWFVKPAIASD